VLGVLTGCRIHRFSGVGDLWVKAQGEEKLMTMMMMMMMMIIIIRRRRTNQLTTTKQLTARSRVLPHKTKIPRRIQEISFPSNCIQAQAAISPSKKPASEPN
jgi:hypothetical protein